MTDNDNNAPQTAGASNDSELSLSKMYEAIDTLNRAGMTISNDNKRQIEAAEAEVISTNVLPALKKIEPELRAGLGPAMHVLRRGVTLIIGYTPGEPLDIRLSRGGRALSRLMSEAMPLPLPVAEQSLPLPVQDTIPVAPKKKRRSSPKSKQQRLRVTLADGNVIQERYAKDTMARAIEALGIDAVAAVVSEKNLKCVGTPILSKQENTHYKQMILGGGWLLMTCSSTKNKKRFLNTVATALGVEMLVETV